MEQNLSVYTESDEAGIDTSAVLKTDFTMDDIIAMGAKYKFRFAVTDEKLSQAEAEIGAPFADDYKAFVKKYGFCEIWGVDIERPTHIVRLKEILPEHLANKRDWYLVADFECEGYLLFQNSRGETFVLAPAESDEMEYDSMLRKAGDSLADGIIWYWLWLHNIYDKDIPAYWDSIKNSENVFEHFAVEDQKVSEAFPESTVEIKEEPKKGLLSRIFGFVKNHK